ncbi:MAG: caspase family protein [Saprospiraceae bacterium]
MNLYALLIGINDYPSKPLTQCVADAGKMEAYLNSIKTSFSDIKIKRLHNEEATRINIIKQINEFLSEATDEDVALLYYSGHGAQEESAGRFSEEQDGLLECMVCYSAGDLSTSQLLADQELRYLLYKLKANPHLLTVFDSCHSGDIVRSFHHDEDQSGKVKRIAGAFEARDYATFVFAGDPEVEEKQDGLTHVFIPYKNHIHLAACLSSESSWEDSKGGVFTRYLIGLLKATNGDLSYLDIARWSKISLKSVTEKNQTPAITVQGEGKLNADSRWLNLNPGTASSRDGTVASNADGEWVYSRGNLLGLQPGMQVIISLDNKEEIKLQVKEAQPDHSILEVPMDIVNKLGFDKKIYSARTEITTYAGLKLFINAIDDDSEIIKSLHTIFSANEKVNLTQANGADFFLNVFNGMVYFSLPEHEFQPLAEQILTGDKVLLQNKLNAQLKSFIKWNHFYSLDNPGKDFEKCPIKVELLLKTGEYIEITNSTHRLLPNAARSTSGKLFATAQVKITNLSNEPLFVGVLTLGSDLSITSKPFEGNVVLLAPGKSKTLYDHNQKKEVSITLDSYKEVYNWKEEWFYYKFIFNNFEDFSPALNTTDFLQPALDPPLTLPDTKGLRSARGEGGEVEEVQKKWGTCRTRIELANSSYNIFSGHLLEHQEEYGKSKLLSPFIKELYFEEHFNGKLFELSLKQNKDQSASTANRATHNVFVKLFNYIYKSARRKTFFHNQPEDRPIVIAEGDSWFLYPKPGVRDTLDYIMQEYRLLSLAEAGDEITDYLKKGDLLEAVDLYKPEYVLISGGGNDILGPEIKQILNNNVINGKLATDYLVVDEFNKKLNFLSDGYQSLFKKIIALVPNVIIFVHGYDYVRSNPDENTIKHGWANRYMKGAGIQQPELRKLVITYLVDQFNDMLREFENQYKTNVIYVNNRSTVLENEWMDEIHPNNIGFQKVANNFLAKMKQH